MCVPILVVVLVVLAAAIAAFLAGGRNAKISLATAARGAADLATLKSILAQHGVKI